MTTYRSPLVAALALLLGACAGGDTGKVSLRLTDAPGDFRTAVVTIAEVHLQGDGGSTVLTTTPVTTNLLTLANDAAELVKDVDVPVGTYRELRFVITGGYIEVEQADQTTLVYASSPDYAGLPAGTAVAGPLRMPSFGQSGLKVKLAEPLVLTTAGKLMMVDFDVSQSFGHEAGNSGAWVMHPVIRAEAAAQVGSLDVNVRFGVEATPPEGFSFADCKAVLTQAPSFTKELPLVLTPTGASVRFQYVFAGTYALDLHCPAPVTTLAPLPMTVVLDPGEDRVADIVVTSAQ
jgi:hypothetical protein